MFADQDLDGIDGLDRRSVEVSTGELRFVDHGEGPAVVLVHGSPVSSFAFRHQVRALSDSYRFVVPDLPTFGESEGPREGADFPVLAEALTELLDAIDVRARAVAGHDWGGPVAAAAVTRRPDPVEQFVLVNATVRRDFEPPCYWRPFVAPVVGEVVVDHLDAVGWGLGLMLEAAREEPARSVYRRALRRRPTRRTVLKLERLARYRELMADVETRLPALDLDLAAIWGHPDEYFRSSGLAYLRDAYDLDRVIELHGAGHFPMEDAPGAFTRALETCLHDG